MANKVEAKKTAQGAMPSDVLRYYEETYSLDDCVFAAGNTLAIGQVVAKDGAGKIVPLAAGQTAVGIVSYDVDAQAADVEGYFVARLAEAASAGLIYFTGADAAAIETANAQMADRGIVVRTSA